MTVTPTTDAFSSADQFGDGYVARIPINDVVDEESEVILSMLLSQWLEHYQGETIVADFALEEFKIESISQSSKQLKPQYEMIADVVYSVKRTNVDVSSWLAGCAEIQENGWVRRCDTFGFFRDGEDFRLRLLPGWGT